MFPQPAVAAALSNYVEARYHTDDDVTKAVQLEIAGTLTQPTFVIVDPNTMEVIRQSPVPLLSEAKALAFLEPR